MCPPYCLLFCTSFNMIFSRFAMIYSFFFFFLMIRRPPRSTLSSSSAASDVYKRQPLVEACALSGTSYCDLTGEASWHATMYNLYENQAKETGARIVPQAGFDSVPSDIGTMLAASVFRERYGKPPDEVHNFVSLRGGGVQGGTIDTVLNEIANAPAIARAKRESLEGAPPLPNKGSTRLAWAKFPFWSSLCKKWCIPFIMAGANMPYVLRSNGRMGYSPNLVYAETQVFGSLLKASLFYLVLLIGGILLYFRPTRWLMQRYVLPSPGQGPSKETQEKGSWKMLFVALSGNERVDVTIDAIGDASCISTTCCLAETAMSLSQDVDQLSSSGGVMTASAAVGSVLLNRLRASGKFKIEANAVSGGGNQQSSKM
eukprot:TRINITY_DN8718_c0_g1_i7.p1 TRINITY_DN8718_c0_g1~~TRINITY_DN8718_c0_g1_i7.p1  ORF type:complete len:372 (+),score=96.47 TRINITY_DN8718_c0_g1_i7:42-1157(+)